MCVREWEERYSSLAYVVCHWRVSSELLVQGDEREKSLLEDTRERSKKTRRRALEMINY